MRVTSLVIASLLLIMAPAFADGLKKTDLPPGEYEFFGSGESGKTTMFVVLSDGTGALKSRNWVQKSTRFPLSALKPGIYRRMHFNIVTKHPDIERNPEIDKFEILADGSLKLDPSIEDGACPFESSKQISDAPYTNF